MREKYGESREDGLGFRVGCFLMSVPEMVSLSTLGKLIPHDRYAEASVDAERQYRPQHILVLVTGTLKQGPLTDGNPEIKRPQHGFALVLD